MGIFDLFKRQSSLLAVDIGSSGVKLLELDRAGEKPLLVNMAFAPLSSEVFNGHVINNTEKVAEAISTLIENTGIESRQTVISLPCPSVITKRLRMAKQPYSELMGTVEYEASQFIPHSLDAVRLDFQVLGESADGEFEVLVVAVKNDVLDSYLDTLSLAGLEASIADVDCFAVQNMFEMAAPEDFGATTALLDVGARFTGITICREGVNLFTGDVAIGGKSITEAIAEEIGLSEAEAERMKRALNTGGANDEVRDLVDRSIDQAVHELSRQLSFFWNSTGLEGGIEKIILVGGAAQTAGFVETLIEKTGVHSQLVDPLKNVELGASIDESSARELAPVMGVAIGLGLRQVGDRDMSFFS